MWRLGPYFFSFLLFFGLPVLSAAFLLRLWLLKKQEYRLWVWFFSFGLIAAAWLLQRAPTGPGPARVLAVVLALGAVIFALRPVHALRTGGAAACPAHEVAAASDSARCQPGAHPAHPPAAEMASMR